MMKRGWILGFLTGFAILAYSKFIFAQVVAPTPAVVNAPIPFSTAAPGAVPIPALEPPVPFVAVSKMNTTVPASMVPSVPSDKIPGAPMLTLKEAIFIGLRCNPDVQNGEIQRVVDKFNLRVARYPFQLNYSLTGALTYNNTVSSGVNSESTNYNITPGVGWLSPIGTKINITAAHVFNHTASEATFFNPLVTATVVQPLLAGFGPNITLAPLYNAYDQERIARLTLKNTIMSTITAVITAYTGVIQAQNTLRAQELALASAIASVHETQAQIKAGKTAPADIVQFQANVASQEVALESQKIALQQAKLTLLVLLGLDPNTQFNVPNEVKLDDSCTPNLQQSIQLALQNDITYQSQQLALKIARRQLYVNRDAERVQLDGTLTQTFGGGSGGEPNSGYASLVNGQNKSTTLGLQLTVPIDNVPLRAATVGARVAVQQLEITMAQQKKVVIANTINGFNTLQIQKDQIKQAQAAVQLADTSLKNANVRLNYGRSSPFEVTTLQNNLTSAQISLIGTEIGYVNTLAAFDQTLGITFQRWCVKVRY